MSRASSSVGAAAGSPSRVRDGGVLGPGDLRKGEDAAPGRGEARGGHRERGGSPGPGLPVWAGLRACSAVTEPAEFSKRPTQEQSQCNGA